jgi:hypothetical protein
MLPLTLAQPRVLPPVQPVQQISGWGERSGGASMNRFRDKGNNDFSVIATALCLQQLTRDALAVYLCHNFNPGTDHDCISRKLLERYTLGHVVVCTYGISGLCDQLNSVAGFVSAKR